MINRVTMKMMGSLSQNPKNACVVKYYCCEVMTHVQGVGSLVTCRFKFIEKFKESLKIIFNGADTAYIYKHSACLHTQKCPHHVSI